MALKEISASSIEVIFEGLLILALDARPNPNPGSQCAVHIPDHAPGHILTVSVQQMREDRSFETKASYGEPDLNRYFGLEVTDVSRPGFGFEAGFFDRAVDLETSEFYDKRVNLRPAAVLSTFHFNNGAFRVAGNLSRDRLTISRGGGAPTPKRPVALRVAADIALDREDSRATFANRGDLFVFRPGGRPARINITHITRADDHSTPHANNYNRVIAFDEPEEAKIRFHPDPDFRHDDPGGQHTHGEHEAAAAPLLPLFTPPHAVCFSAFLGRGTQ